MHIFKQPVANIQYNNLLTYEGVSKSFRS